MSNKPIHIHKNIVDRNRNIFLLFLPAVIFVLFLTIMFSFYKVKELPRNTNKAILGEQEDIDNKVEFNAQ
jgi:CHASE3 domain sensor protein